MEQPITHLDEFLGSEEPCATLHDARLISLQINYEQRELVSDWEVFVGSPSATDLRDRERTRRGRLRLTGLSFWVVEPHDPLVDGSRPWLTADGPLLEADTDMARKLSAVVRDGSSAWYLYFSDWNALAYCCAKGGSFEWIG